MSYKVIDFPQYRKLSNEKVFYKISSAQNFEEIQLVGKRANKYSFVANKYPELLRVMDMLECSDGYLTSDFEEFNGLIEQYAL